MRALVWVALGGATGAVARYAISTALARYGGFPWATLLVNALGSLLLGALMEACLHHPRWPPELRLLVGTGFCGALTTFSTFSVETLALPPGRALLNIAANLLVSLGMAALGIGAVRLLQGIVPPG